MNSNYKVLKYESGQTKEIKDQISIEEQHQLELQKMLRDFV